MTRMTLVFAGLLFVGCGVGSESKANDYYTPMAADAASEMSTSTISGSGDAPSNSAGSTPGRDASLSSSDAAVDASPGLVEQAAEYLTCKPDELNPIVDCVTAKCPMQSNPLALLTCLVGDCGTLVAGVSPKCRDCVVSGVAQDTQGLAQNCLDTNKIVGDAGLGVMLP